MPESPATPSLVKALSEACDRCQAAHKDKENTFHKFHYASAEAVLTTATEALRGSGLALVPTGAAIRAIEQTHILVRYYDLTHSSGESRPIVIEFPIVIPKGQDFRTAYATALTSCLAYTYRDLLRMPRVDPATDLAGQEQHEPEQPVKQAVKSVPEYIASIDQRFAELKVSSPGYFTAHVKQALSPTYGDDPATWPRTAKAEIKQLSIAYKAMQEASKAMAGPNEIAALRQELHRVGESWANAFDAAGLRGQDAKMEHLTSAMVAELMERLKPLPDAPRK